MDPLFPALPKDISDKGLSDKALNDLLAEYEQAHGLIMAETSEDAEARKASAEFLDGYSADEISKQHDAAVDDILALRAEVQAREEAVVTYEAGKAERDAKINGEPVAEAAADEENGDAENGDEAEPEEDEAKAEAEVEADDVEAPADDRELALVADATTTTSSNSDASVTINVQPRLRRAVPAPTA